MQLLVATRHLATSVFLCTEVGTAQSPTRMCTGTSYCPKHPKTESCWEDSLASFAVPVAHPQQSALVFEAAKYFQFSMVLISIGQSAKTEGTQGPGVGSTPLYVA